MKHSERELSTTAQQKTLSRTLPTCFFVFLTFFTRNGTVICVSANSFVDLYPLSVFSLLFLLFFTSRLSKKNQIVAGNGILGLNSTILLLKRIYPSRRTRQVKRRWANRTRQQTRSYFRLTLSWYAWPVAMHKAINAPVAGERPSTMVHRPYVPGLTTHWRTKMHELSCALDS